MHQTNQLNYAPLGLDPVTRSLLWDDVVAALEQYAVDVRTLPVAPRCSPSGVRSALAELSPDTPLAPQQAVRLVIDLLRAQQVHAAHPGYFGLFVPAPSAIGVISDALVAGFNPQLASWSHSPFGVEAELWVVRAVSSRLGFAGGATEGTITTGGSEANLTALLVGLHQFHTYRPNRTTVGARQRASRASAITPVESSHAMKTSGWTPARFVACCSKIANTVSALSWS
jgi:hypothetical protein